MSTPDENAANLSNDTEAIYQVRDREGIYTYILQGV